MAVGLFGGSFNPPHAGHALVAEIALRRLALNQLWWIVTPGNPLKGQTANWRRSPNVSGYPSNSPAIPRIKVTAFEAHHHVRYTADTLALVKARNPGVDFVWIMGADNLARLPSLATLAPDRDDLSDRRDRPPGIDTCLSVFGRRKDVRLCARRRRRCASPCAHAGAGMDLHSRAAILSFLYSAAARCVQTSLSQLRLIAGPGTAQANHVAFTASCAGPAGSLSRWKRR